ncbi:hypothetical protein E6O75_ATG01664 [Venturia nashicola]|uniref:BTB domain-containing protein n=1 Tax=Venturia nashicola TaxID=86259 RepID=A0A4Z1P0I1_9PEZI|nr:hypothetical protein E6O75_ATG01664 [Venturia nashicola]
MSATMTKFEPSFLDNVGTDLVTIQIGDGDTQESFPVHKDLLTACSPYFKAAFDGEFREAPDKAIPIPDVTSTQVRLFLDWLYFRRLPDDKESSFGSAECQNCTYTETTCEDSRRAAGFTEDFVDHDDEEEHSRIPFEGSASISEEVDQHLEELINNGPWNHEMLYVFADRCDVPDLRQDLINEAWKNGWPTFGAIIFAWRNLSIKSPLCKLILDDYSRLHEKMDLMEEEKCGMEVLLRQKLPSEFMRILFSRNLGDEEEWPPVCAYHEHAQDEETVEKCREEMQRRDRRGRG